MKSVDFSISGVRCSDGVVKCVNLIPDRSLPGLPLMPAPTPCVVDEGEWHPFHIHCSADAVYTFFHNGSTVAGVSRVAVMADGGVLTPAGAFSGAILTAVSCDASTVAVCTEAGRYRLRLSGGRWGVAASADVVLPRIAPRVNFTYTMTTETMHLRGVSAADARLTASAREEVGRCLISGYEAMAEAAAGAGMWIQPMAVCLKLIDFNGTVSYTSPPLLMAPRGWQCADAVTVDVSHDGDDTLTVPEMRVDADGYLLDVEFPAGLRDSVAFVEVWAMPQFHPMVRTEEAPCRLISRSDGLRLTTALPGATRNFGSRDDERERQVAAVIPRVAAEGRRIGRFDVKLCAGTTVTLRAQDAGLADSDLLSSRYASVMDKGGSTSDLAVEDSVMSMLDSGAVFMAGAVAVSGDCVLWGDIRLLPAGVPCPDFYVAERTGDAAASWTAAVDVTMADGSHRVSHYECSGGLPTSLLPFVCYPSRDAVMWRLVIEDEDGAVRSVAVPLTAAADGSQMACYAASKLRYIALEDVEESLPAETSAAMSREPSMLLMCRADEPLRPVAAMVCGSGRVAAVVPAVRSRSAWDAVRSRFVVFGTSGIHAVTCAPRTLYMGATLVDGAVRVPSARAVASTPHGVMALWGSRLVCVQSSVAKVVEVGLADPLALAWHPGMEMLLTVDRNGNLSARSLTDGGVVSHCCDLPLPFTPKVLMAGADGGMWLSSDAGTHYMGCDGGVAARTSVKWCGDAVTPRGMRAVCLRLDMTGGEVRGDVALRAHGGVGVESSLPVVKLGVAGSVNHPLRLRVLAPPRRNVTLAIDGEVSADFRLFGAGVDFTGL